MNYEAVSNPLLAGFYPDPSICRVGDDYYLVNSTFSYFPGVPIFHSTDLIHWEQIGNILDRPEQLPLDGAGHSAGIFAPTLRYHDGTFYMITTNVSGGGNFIVTAANPAGPWSNPYWIEGAAGIDPSLFFDDDGKAYYCGTQDRREGPAFYGDNEIYLQEIDLKEMKLIGESYALWHGALKNVEWPEGPHIYKINSTYYLMIAEGGTGSNHAITMAKSDSLFKPFEGCKRNPIFTHRHLGYHAKVTNTGHGDLVQAPNGDWYIVLLASRPYGNVENSQRYCNLGRETFLAKVYWEGEWPTINPSCGMLTDEVLIPVELSTPTNELAFASSKSEDSRTYTFEAPHQIHHESFMPALPYEFIYLRNPVATNYSLLAHPGFLSIYSSCVELSKQESPSAIFLRQVSPSYQFDTTLFLPAVSNILHTGITAYQSNEYYYRLSLRLQATSLIVDIIACHYKEETVLASFLLDEHYEMESSITLSLRQEKQNLSFFVHYKNEQHTIGKTYDASILSTDIAGGFVGTCLGVYNVGAGDAIKIQKMTYTKIS